MDSPRTGDFRCKAKLRSRESIHRVSRTEPRLRESRNKETPVRFGSDQLRRGRSIAREEFEIVPRPAIARRTQPGGMDTRGDQERPGLRGGSRATATPAPFFSADFPYFGLKPPPDIVSFLYGDHAHALPFRNPSGCRVRHSFRSAQYRKPEFIEPIIRHHAGGFAHQTAALPRKPNPKPTIFIFALHQRYDADQLAGRSLEAQGPTPPLAASHCWEDFIPEMNKSAVGRIGPRDSLR